MRGRSGLQSRQHGLQKLLHDKNFFKLICGAGNENLDEVEKLVAIYAKAGCRFFDLSPNKEVIDAAYKGLLRVINKENLSDYHFCVSVGIKGEPHFNKVRINQKNCKKCGKCIEVCLQRAINHDFTVKEEKCIGCVKCIKVCKYNAIEIYQKNKKIDEIFSPLTSHLSLLTCIELHASGIDEKDVQGRWDYLTKNFDGLLSICIDRAKLSNETVLNRIKNLIKDRKPYTTIVQADGAPMSGGEDDFKTTLEAVSMAEIVAKEKLPVYLLISGGTNSKTAELAKLCEVDFNGISVGSYARKIVKNYIEKEDFWTNKDSFKQAVNVAKKLINQNFQ